MEDLQRLLGLTDKQFAKWLKTPFKPCAIYYEGMDWLICLEEDCSYTAKYIPGSRFELLMHPHEDRIVGVKIQGFSELVSPEVLAAYKADLGKFMAEVMAD